MGLIADLTAIAEECLEASNNSLNPAEKQMTIYDMERMMYDHYDRLSRIIHGQTAGIDLSGIREIMARRSDDPLKGEYLQHQLETAE